MKKILLATSLLGLGLVWSCATYMPPPPSLHIEGLSPDSVSRLSLDERILIEEAWDRMRMGDTKKAQKLLAQLGLNSPFYHAGMAYIFLIQNDSLSAEQSFKSALNFMPDMILAHMGLAQLYQAAGRQDEAFTEFREVLKRDPQHPLAKPKYEGIRLVKTEESLEEAKMAHSAGDLETGKAAYLRALYYTPNLVGAHLALAQIYLDEKRAQNALVHIEAALSESPDNTQLLKTQAEILVQLEDYKKSLEILERLQGKEPDDPDIRDSLKTVKNRLGIFELPSQYESLPFSEAISKEDTAALLGVKLKDYLEEPREKPQILVDIATSWASKFIIQTTSLGLLDVYPNHTFQPKKIVTRAEVAEIMTRVIRHLERQGHRFLQQIPPSRIEVLDVSPDNYYYQPIIRMISLDIMSLYPDKTFRPEVPVPGKSAIRLLDIILALIR